MFFTVNKVYVLQLFAVNIECFRGIFAHSQQL